MFLARRDLSTANSIRKPYRKHNIGTIFEGNNYKQCALGEAAITSGAAPIHQDQNQPIANPITAPTTAPIAPPMAAPLRVCFDKQCSTPRSNNEAYPTSNNCPSCHGLLASLLLNFLGLLSLRSLLLLCILVLSNNVSEAAHLHGLGNLQANNSLNA